MDASLEHLSNPYDPCSLENVTFPAILMTNHSDWEALKVVEVDAARRYQPIFPNIEMRVLNLFPDKFYTMVLRIEKVDNWLYKRCPAGVWYRYQHHDDSKAEERSLGMMHPDGNQTGEYWMSKPINFGTIGVTNDPDTIRREKTRDPSKQRKMFLVEHRHKYKVVLGVNNGMGSNAFDTQDCSHPSCEFIAVSERSKDYVEKVKELQKTKGNEARSRRRMLNIYAVMGNNLTNLPSFPPQLDDDKNRLVTGSGRVNNMTKFIADLTSITANATTILARAEQIKVWCNDQTAPGKPHLHEKDLAALQQWIGRLENDVRHARNSFIDHTPQNSSGKDDKPNLLLGNLMRYLRRLDLSDNSLEAQEIRANHKTNYDGVMKLVDSIHNDEIILHETSELLTKCGETLESLKNELFASSAGNQMLTTMERIEGKVVIEVTKCNTEAVNKLKNLVSSASILPPAYEEHARPVEEVLDEDEQESEDDEEESEDDEEESEDDDQKPDNAEQESEGDGQKSDDDKQKSDDDGQNSNDNGQKSNDNDQKSRDDEQKSNDNDQKLEDDVEKKSGDDVQKSDDDEQKSEDNSSHNDSDKDSGEDDPTGGQGLAAVTPPEDLPFDPELFYEDPTNDLEDPSSNKHRTKYMEVTTRALLSLFFGVVEDIRLKNKRTRNEHLFGPEIEYFLKYVSTNGQNFRQFNLTKYIKEQKKNKTGMNVMFYTELEDMLKNKKFVHPIKELLYFFRDMKKTNWTSIYTSIPALHKRFMEGYEGEFLLYISDWLRAFWKHSILEYIGIHIEYNQAIVRIAKENVGRKFPFYEKRVPALSTTEFFKTRRQAYRATPTTTTHKWLMKKFYDTLCLFPKTPIIDFDYDYLSTRPADEVDQVEIDIFQTLFSTKFDKLKLII